MSGRAHRSPIGSVALVGAGPGDPELLTLRAARRLAACDAVVTDALVHPAVLDLVPDRAARFTVGKRAGDERSARQEDITALLISLARAGRTVVRLKGGDPFVFGRGGEEALALAQAGVPFEVVPGLTAATAVTALAHIPVTHRGVARSVALVTASVGDARADDDEGRALADAAAADTVVVYMGGRRARATCDALIVAGRAASTPAAAICAGSYEHERVVVATLFDLPEALAARAVAGAPTLIVVGDVVRLRAALLGLASEAERTLTPAQELP